MKHVFSPEVARHFGVPAALIYQHLVFVSEKRKWRVTASIRDLEKNYPYLSRGAVDGALKRLLKGTQEHPKLLSRRKRTASRAAEYTLDEVNALEAKAGKKFKLNVEVATKHGVVAAVIFENISYWVRSNWRFAASACAEGLRPERYNLDCDLMTYDAMLRTKHTAWHYTTPRRWASEHPYTSQATVERAFRALVSNGLLQIKKGHTRYTGYSLSAYTLMETVISSCNLDEYFNLGVNSGHEPSFQDTDHQIKTPYRQIRTQETRNRTVFIGDNDDQERDKNQSIEAGPYSVSENGKQVHNETSHTSPLRGDGVKFSRRSALAREQEQRLDKVYEIIERIESEDKVRSSPVTEPPKLTYRMLKGNRITPVHRAMTRDFFDFDIDSEKERNKVEKMLEEAQRIRLENRYDTLVKGGPIVRRVAV